MPEFKGIDYLRRKLGIKRRRVDLRYKYYETKMPMLNQSTMIPANFRWIKSVAGWCAKSVDSLANKLVFEYFANDSFEIGDIFNNNSADIFFSSAILDSLIASCSFAYIFKDLDGYPGLQVVDGSNATGELDPTTRLLTEGYAVLKRSDNGSPVTEAYFLPGETRIYRAGIKGYEPIFHDAPVPALVPMIYSPNARRPFGHSRISRSQMYLTQAAMRTLLRTEVASEFYSFPQKYVLGLSSEADRFDKTIALMSSFLDFRKDEDGDKPTVGQFQQQSMSPFTEQIKTYAAMFAGEVGLTLDDLGFSNGNPATKEAIDAAHENLRCTGEAAQRDLGPCLLNVGYVAACIRDKRPYERSAFRRTEPRWKPIIGPSGSQLGATGDAIYKINEAVPGYIGAENMRILTGLRGDNE